MSLKTLTFSLRSGLGVQIRQMLRRSLNRVCLLIRLLPSILIISLSLWSYYAFLFCFFPGNVSGIFNQALVILVYHLNYLLYFWCFIKTLNTPMPKLPQQFLLTAARDQLIKDCLFKEEKNMILTKSIINLSISMRCYDGGIRYCGKCRCLKPDRSHHCSVCETCVLKMDHHCPWVNNCIGFPNYKFFLLFLSYALTYCCFICLNLSPVVTQYMGLIKNDNVLSEPSLHVVSLWIVSTLFIVSLALLLALHGYLLISNQTTMELFQSPRFICGTIKKAFDLGSRENIIQVFGREKKFWFLPISTSLGDGTTFPINDKHKSTIEKCLLALRSKLAEQGLADTASF